MKKLYTILLFACSFTAFAVVEVDYDATVNSSFQQTVPAEGLQITIATHPNTVVLMASGDDVQIVRLNPYNYFLSESQRFNGFSAVIYREGTIVLTINSKVANVEPAIALRTMSVLPPASNEQKTPDLDHSSTLDLLYLTVKHAGKDIKQEVKQLVNIIYKDVKVLEKISRPEVKYVKKKFKKIKKFKW